MIRPLIFTLGELGMKSSGTSTPPANSLSPGSVSRLDSVMMSVAGSPPRVDAAAIRLKDAVVAHDSRFVRPDRAADRRPGSRL